MAVKLKVSTKEEDTSAILQMHFLASRFYDAAEPIAKDAVWRAEAASRERDERVLLTSSIASSSCGLQPHTK